MVDITIKGAGIFGLSIAWVCIQRGAKVQVIDPHGVAAGASGGIVGALAPHVPENWNEKKAFQLESLLHSQDFWQGVTEASGLPTGYGRTGRLQPILDERALELARSRAETARDLWQRNATWRVIRAENVGSWTLTTPTGWLIHDDLSARLHPRKACLALARAIADNGGIIETHGPERGVVCHATGWAGLRALSDHFDRPAGDGVKGQAALLGYEAADFPQLFVDGLHIIPHNDGTTAIGSTSERQFDSPDQTDSNIDALIEKARAAVPSLRQAPILTKWANVRPRAKSRAPLMGRWPDRPDHFIANGGFKIGFGMAPKIAECMADLMLDGDATFPDSFNSEVQLA